jgi:hypothetical protein
LTGPGWTAAACCAVSALGVLLALAFASPAVMVLAFLCFLLALWVSGPTRYARWVAKSPEFRFDRSKERLP